MTKQELMLIAAIRDLKGSNWRVEAWIRLMEVLQAPIAAKGGRNRPPLWPCMLCQETDYCNQPETDYNGTSLTRPERPTADGENQTPWAVIRKQRETRTTR